MVSARRGRPIIDMNTAQIVQALGAAEKVEVHATFGKIEITQAEVEKRAAARQDNRSRTVGSIFSGGGLLDEAAKQAGFTPTFGVEVNEQYADTWQLNHAGHLFHGSIHEVFGKLPQVELLVGGIPCEPYSAKRRNGANEKASGTPGDHELADMSTWAVFASWVSNPRVIVWEEVPAYLESDIGKVTLAALRRLGYTVEARLIAGTDYGSLTVRKRTVIVAKQDGCIDWPTTAQAAVTLGAILLPPDDPRCEWFDAQSKPWLFEHWAKQTEKGNGFASQVLTAATARVPAVSKRYFAGQGDGAVVAHPTDPAKFRWLTLDEVKRLFGLPADYVLPQAKTVAGEILGQAVLVDVFARIIKAVTV